MFMLGSQIHMNIWKLGFEMKQYIFQKNLTYSSDSLNCNDIKVFNTLKTFEFAKNKTLSSIYSNKIVTFIILNLFVTFLTTK